MRRFMQTFVLVPQMPKKFYVHNDIFRYQDEVFHDEDGDPDEADSKLQMKMNSVLKVLLDGFSLFCTGKMTYV